VSIFSSQSGNLIGVDIGSSSIKLVQLSRSRSGYELVSMAVVPLPRDAIVENTIIDSAAISEALVEALKRARPSTKHAALTVSGNAVIIKSIKLPLTTEFELEAQIEYEAEQYVPYEIDDVFLDFHIQGIAADDPEQMDVVLVACKREVVEDYQQIFNEAGLQVKCIDCDVFALENAAEITDEHTAVASDVYALPDEDAEVNALINIGANMININVLIDGRMAFVRDQFFGGQHLTEEIQKEHNISYQAAEQLKIENFEEIYPNALERFYIDLTSELVRSLDFYGDRGSEFPVRKLYLSGGCALLPNIATELEQRLGIDTAVLNPFDNISVPSGKFDVENLQKTGPMMMVPVGLALRSFDT